MRGLRDRGKENGGFVVMADEWSESGSFCARTRLLLSLMLFRIFSEPLMSISNKHSYKTFSKSPPVSLLHCIENISSSSSGNCHDSLTMAALSFTNGCSEFHLCTIFIH